MDGLEPYEDPRGFSLLVPIGWELAVDPRADTALLVVEPDQGAGFRANVVVTLDELPPELDFQSWQATVEPLLEHALGDYLLIDLEGLDDSSGGPTTRRLVHHVVDESGPVTAEQWSSARGRTGYTLTCSVATAAYDSLADILTSIGQSWSVPA